MTTLRRLLPHVMMNLRELGGYPTRDQKATRFRRFLRGDAPVALQEEDVRYLENYGVAMVIDMRSPDELVAQPNCLANLPGIDYRPIPFTDDFTLFADLRYSPHTHFVPVLKGQHRVKEIFEAMGECPSGKAVYFHCAVGKDRTGIVSCLLLRLAQVYDEDIKADYQVSYTYIQKYIDAMVKLFMQTDSAQPGLCRTEPEWIEPLLQFIDESGGIEQYLLSLGISETCLLNLKARLCE